MLMSEPNLSSAGPSLDHIFFSQLPEHLPANAVGSDTCFSVNGPSVGQLVLTPALFSKDRIPLTLTSQFFFAHPTFSWKFNGRIVVMSGPADHPTNGDVPPAPAAAGLELAATAADAGPGLPVLQSGRSRGMFSSVVVTGKPAAIFKDQKHPHCPDSRNVRFVNLHLKDKVLRGIEDAAAKAGIRLSDEDAKWLREHDGRFVQFQHHLDPNTASQRSNGMLQHGGWRANKEHCERTNHIKLEQSPRCSSNLAARSHANCEKQLNTFWRFLLNSTSCRIHH